MKKIIFTTLIMSCLIHQGAISQTSVELKEACLVDFELTGYIVDLITTGSSSMNFVTTGETQQIKEILANEADPESSTKEKLNVVITACSEGRILQARNSYILNNN